MAYGKLGLIKTISHTPVFTILDKEDKPTTIIPTLDEWLAPLIGHIVNVDISDDHFIINKIKGGGK